MLDLDRRPEWSGGRGCTGCAPLTRGPRHPGGDPVAREVTGDDLGFVGGQLGEAGQGLLRVMGMAEARRCLRDGGRALRPPAGGRACIRAERTTGSAPRCVSARRRRRAGAPRWGAPGPGGAGLRARDPDRRRGCRGLTDARRRARRHQGGRLVASRAGARQACAPRRERRAERARRRTARRGGGASGARAGSGRVARPHQEPGKPMDGSRDAARAPDREPPRGNPVGRARRRSRAGAPASGCDVDLPAGARRSGGRRARARTSRRGGRRRLDDGSPAADVRGVDEPRNGQP